MNKNKTSFSNNKYERTTGNLSMYVSKASSPEPINKTVDIRRGVNGEIPIQYYFDSK